MKSITKKNIRTSFYPLWQQYNKFKAYLLRYPKSGNGFEAVSQSKMIQYNKVRYHGAKPLFCYNPFVNIFFNINGDAIACCRSHETVLGKYPEQSIKEIWFGKRFEKMREHMLHNDLNMGCNYCKLQIESRRFHSIPSVHADQYASSKNGKYPKVIELELSNNCNLQCVMCTGRVSSSILKYREKLPPIVSPYDDAFVNQLKEFIPHVKKICFYGGEPFLIDIYYKIWDIIIELNPKVEVLAVTNGTIFNQRIKTIVESINFSIVISIDSLKKERFEKIRKGADFDVVINNFHKFRKIVKSQITISHTPMILNWRETPAIIEFGNQYGAHINLSFVEKPSHLALWNLTPQKLQEIYEYYNSIEWDMSYDSVITSYNLRVFNEWKEQVRFFRDRNSDILQSFEDIDQLFNNSLINLHEVSKKLFKLISKNCIIYDEAMKIIDYQIIQKTRTPIHVIAIDHITSDMERLISNNKPMEAEKVLKDKTSFTQYVLRYLNEDTFYSTYY